MKPSSLSTPFFKRSAIKSSYIPVLILLVGIFIAYKAEYFEQQQQVLLVEQTLHDDLTKVKDNFSERIAFYSYGLKGLHGLVSSIGLANFDYQTMLNYSKNREVQQEFPGVRGLGFIQKVEPHELDEFLYQQQQMRPDKTFGLRQLSLHQQSLFIIRYIEPEAANKSAVGLDIGSESNRRNAAINAAMQNKIQITAPITLVQADEKIKHGFLILLPLYAAGTSAEQVDNKLSNVLGWTYAPILINEVLGAMEALPTGLKLTIKDVTDQGKIRFFDSLEDDLSQSQYTISEQLMAFGREWEFTLSAADSYIKNTKSTQPYFTFYQFMIYAVVIALGAFSLILLYLQKQELHAHEQKMLIEKDKELEKANEKLEELVEMRTKEISDINSLQRAILQHTDYPIIASDSEGLITMFNPAAERILGYSAEEVLGKETPGLFHLYSEIKQRKHTLSKKFNVKFSSVMDVFTAKVDRGLEDNANWTYVTKSGKHIPIRLHLTALKNDQQQITGYLGISYDLTEQIERENALAEAKNIAEKANVAKSEFLANMSHEIRTPLNGIFGTLQLLVDETDRVKKNELIELALRSTTTLNKLVNDILDISKLEAGKLELDITAVNLVELTTVIKSELMTSLRGKGLNLNVQIELEHAVWMVDELRLKQVLLNVLSNAIKFTKRGEIILALLNDEKGGILISIQDPGIGMSKEAQERLFQRFEQADKSITRRYGGTGLGMSITHSLVELMQGNIEVSSIENLGTTIQIFLPLQAVTSPLPSLAINDLSIETLAGKAILIAEDNEINQLILSSMLEHSDATIFMVNNGELAVDFIVHNEVDIILMDIQMPVMGGVEACKLIKAEHPDLPIIAITANAFQQDIKLYAEVGFDSYIAKPFEKKYMLKTIVETLSK